jgi:hypothetical protein
MSCRFPFSGELFGTCGVFIADTYVRDVLCTLMSRYRQS